MHEEDLVRMMFHDGCDIYMSHTRDETRNLTVETQLHADETRMRRGYTRIGHGIKNYTLTLAMLVSHGNLYSQE